MGRSADVTVWFGFFWSKDERLPDEVLRTMGVEEDDDGFVDFDHDTIMEGVEERLKPLGCEIVYTNCWDYPNYGLAVTASRRSVYVGNAMRLDEPRADPEWAAKVTEAAKAIGWPVDKEPAYLAAPMYG